MSQLIILLSGSAGFIGFHLASALARAGHRVVGIDNLNDYYDPNLKIDRLVTDGFLANEVARLDKRAPSSIQLRRVLKDQR